MRLIVLIAAASLLTAPAWAQSPWDAAKKVAGGAATGTLEKEINKRLLEDARKNQCTFKSGTDKLEKGCDKKASKLAKTLLDSKKKLNDAGVQNFKFEVSGHTDSSGDPEKNKELSMKRAEVLRKELIKKGVPEADIVAVGRGSEEPLEKPDDTPKKKARNRRYELRVRL